MDSGMQAETLHRFVDSGSLFSQYQLADLRRVLFESARGAQVALPKTMGSCSASPCLARRIREDHIYPYGQRADSGGPEEAVEGHSGRL